MELKLRADIVAVQAIAAASATFAAAVSAAINSALSAPSAHRIKELHRRYGAWTALRPVVARIAREEGAAAAAASAARTEQLQLGGGVGTHTEASGATLSQVEVSPPLGGGAASPSQLEAVPFPGATLSLCLRHALLSHEENEGVRSLRQWSSTGFALGW